jgi:hypothetical protein
MGAESSLRNIVLDYKQGGVLDKNRPMHVQKHNICRNYNIKYIPSHTTFS